MCHVWVKLAQNPHRKSHLNATDVQAPTILATLLGRFEVELDDSMGGVAGMLARQTNTFTISIDQVTFCMCLLLWGISPSDSQ